MTFCIGHWKNFDSLNSQIFKSVNTSHYAIFKKITLINIICKYYQSHQENFRYWKLSISCRETSFSNSYFHLKTQIFSLAIVLSVFLKVPGSLYFLKICVKYPNLNSCGLSFFQIKVGFHWNFTSSFYNTINKCFSLRQPLYFIM